MRAVPVIDGIVVPEQYEAVLLEASIHIQKDKLCF
jgi:hypothetical protein